MPLRSMFQGGSGKQMLNFQCLTSKTGLRPATNWSPCLRYCPDLHPDRAGTCVDFPGPFRSTLLAGVGGHIISVDHLSGCPLHKTLILFPQGRRKPALPGSGQPSELSEIAQPLSPPTSHISGINPAPKFLQGTNSSPLPHRDKSL